MALEIFIFLVQNCHYTHCAYCPKLTNNKDTCSLVKQVEIYVLFYLLRLKNIGVSKTVLN